MFQFYVYLLLVNKIVTFCSLSGTIGHNDTYRKNGFTQASHKCFMKKKNIYFKIQHSCLPSNLLVVQLKLEGRKANSSLS